MNSKSSRMPTLSSTSLKRRNIARPTAVRPGGNLLAVNYPFLIGYKERNENTAESE